MITVLFGLIIALLPSTTCAAEPRCLQYAPDATSLTGTVIYRTFSDAVGRPERVPLLLLDHPICVLAPKDERRDIYVDAGDQIVVQLNMDPIIFGKEQVISGRRASVSGALHHRHTSHHHADLFLMVQQVNVAK